jgi:hypothetical protein
VRSGCMGYGRGKKFETAENEIKHTWHENKRYKETDARERAHTERQIIVLPRGRKSDNHKRRRTAADLCGCLFSEQQ